MPRRHSRTPPVLTDYNRRVMIKAADANPELRAQIETLIGKPWGSLTAEQKIGTLTDFEEVGYAAGSLAGAERGRRAMEAAAEQRRGDVALADRVAMQDEQLAAQSERIAALEADNAKLRRTATRTKAASALAVHSEGTR